jgi:hypothetical protein
MQSTAQNGSVLAIIFWALDIIGDINTFGYLGFLPVTGQAGSQVYEDLHYE